MSRKAGKTYSHKFSRSWYEKKMELAGCLANALFWYHRVQIHLDANANANWKKKGAAYMHHRLEKVKKHEEPKIHIDSCLKLSAFGKVIIASKLDESYRIAE